MWRFSGSALFFWAVGALGGCAAKDGVVGETDGDVSADVNARSQSTQYPRRPGSLGSVCVPGDEQVPEFAGYGLSEVVVEENDSCGSGLCVVQHFQGRVSCPYGQQASTPECTLPDSEELVTVDVAPQLLGRPPELASTCSCRCAGPGDGPFCECGAGLICADLIDSLNVGDSSYAGSYCVPDGSLNWREQGAAATCDAAAENCGATHPY